MRPAARELAIQTGMELHDALAEKRKQDIQPMVNKEWASKRAALYKQASEEQANRLAEQIAMAVEAAAADFKDHLTIIDSRVEKEAGYFERPELLYGVLRWLATVPRQA
jgi:hypothetical protein